MLSVLVAAMAAAARSSSVVSSSSSSVSASRSLVTRAASAAVAAGPLARRSQPTLSPSSETRRAAAASSITLPVLRAYAADAALDQTSQNQHRAPPQPHASVGVVSAQAAATAPNAVTLLGRLNSPFDVRSVSPRQGSFGSSSGPSCVATSQLSFSVGRDKTEWVAVEAWGALAEAAASSGLAAGDRVLATGRLRCNEYSDRQTGQRRRSIKVTLDSISRVHDGPGAASAGAGGEWGDQWQASPGEWTPSSGGSASGATSPMPSWPAPDAGVDWNAAAVVPETQQDWSAAAGAAPSPEAWGGAQQGADALAWGAAAPRAPAASELAPWDAESPESWGAPSAVPAPSAAPPAPLPQQQQHPGGQQTGEHKWASFFSDPSSYWDNRLSKRSPRAPDFKHKTSGEGLWVSSRDTPAWVEQRLGELPPPRAAKF